MSVDGRFGSFKVMAGNDEEVYSKVQEARCLFSMKLAKFWRFFARQKNFFIMDLLRSSLWLTRCCMTEREIDFL